MTSTA